MSGSSDSSTCPNCGQECNEYSDSKPFSYSDTTCIECGFYTVTIVKYMDLEELNERRHCNLQHPLVHLPEQTFKH